MKIYRSKTIQLRVCQLAIHVSTIQPEMSDISGFQLELSRSLASDPNSNLVPRVSHFIAPPGRAGRAPQGAVR